MNHKRVLPFLIILPLLGLSACLPSADFKVSMRLTDEGTGQPIPDAWVFVLAKAEAVPPREGPYNRALVAARGKTDAEGFLRLGKVQGFYWGEEPQDGLWKMLEARKPKVKRMVASIEGGDIFAFAKDYGALHHYFGVKDNLGYQEQLKKAGEYEGVHGGLHMRGEDRPIELKAEDLKNGVSLDLEMRKPENRDYLMLSFHPQTMLLATWGATTWKTGTSRKEKEQVYDFFVKNELPLIEWLEQTGREDTGEMKVKALQDPKVRETYMSHSLDQSQNHETVVHAWLTQKAAELLPAGEYDEVKQHLADIQEGVKAEDDGLLLLNHFYNPNAPETGIWGHDSALKWGSIGHPDNPKNDWDMTDAVRYYQRGETKKAYQALGHVLHLLQDMSVPMHTHMIEHNAWAFPQETRFETHFSELGKKNNGSLPPEYSQASTTPKKPGNLKRYFDELASLTFGEFQQDFKTVNFDDYYGQGMLVKAPDDKTLELMGKYLFPKAIEYSAGFLARFYDGLHPQQYAQLPKKDEKGKVGWDVTGQSSMAEHDILPAANLGIAKSKSEALTAYLKRSRIKDFSHRIEVTPVRQSTGIASGVVMAYGHIIPPPYQVESQGRKLLVNGVQVMPSLVIERFDQENPKRLLSPEKEAAFLEQGRLLRVAGDMYRQGKGTESQQQLHREILDYIERHAKVKLTAEWRHEAICITPAEFPVTECRGFGPSSFPSAEVLERQDAAMRTDRIFGIEKALREGQAVIFDYRGQQGFQADFRGIVNEIMQLPLLSREQRIELLNSRVFHGYGSAIDVVDNYEKEEWAVLQ